MQIVSKTENDVLFLSVEDTRLDAAGAVDFKEKIRHLIQGHTGRVVINMGKVEFLDSSGLGALVAVMKLLEGGRRLELANCGTIVRKVLTLTRMDSIFVLHDSLQDAA